VLLPPYQELNDTYSYVYIYIYIYIYISPFLLDLNLLKKHNIIALGKVIFQVCINCTLEGLKMTQKESKHVALK